MGVIIPLTVVPTVRAISIPLSLNVIKRQQYKNICSIAVNSNINIIDQPKEEWGSISPNKATLFCCKIIIPQVIKGVQFDSYQGFKLLTRMIACTKWRPKTLTIYIYICIIGSYIINGKKGQLYGGITEKKFV
jgi:hypothetical protein